MIALNIIFGHPIARAKSWHCFSRSAYQDGTPISLFEKDLRKILIPVLYAVTDGVWAFYNMEEYR